MLLAILKHFFHFCELYIVILSWLTIPTATVGLFLFFKRGKITEEPPEVPQAVEPKPSGSATEPLIDTLEEKVTESKQAGEKVSDAPVASDSVLVQEENKKVVSEKPHEETQEAKAA